MTTIKQLSESLGAHRAQADLSVNDLATQSGVARAALYRFAKGGDVRLSTFLAMADTLGLDMVLAPKAVSVSLRPPVSAQPSTGPRSAVEARLAKVQVRMQKDKP
jgi:predicted transcriptional regulator